MSFFLQEAIPQYKVGHLQLLDKIKDSLKNGHDKDDKDDKITAAKVASIITLIFSFLMFICFKYFLPIQSPFVRVNNQARVLLLLSQQKGRRLWTRLLTASTR